MLFKEKVRGRWRGRTPTNKLVFVESDENLCGQVREVRITWTGPWSMQGALAQNASEKLPELTTFSVVATHTDYPPIAQLPIQS